MKLETFFAIVKASKLIPGFCPNITNWKNKMRGESSRGVPLQFSDEDLAAMQRAMDEFNKLVQQGLKN